MSIISKKISDKLPWRTQTILGYRPKSCITIRKYFKKESIPNLEGEFYKKMLFEGEISLNPAKAFNDVEHNNFNEVTKKTYDECLVLGLVNARYIQHTWVPTYIASNNVLISDANMDPKKGRVLHPIFTKQDVGNPILLIGKSLVLCNDGCHNGYFHWIARMLPKLWVLRANNMSIEDFDHIVVNGPEIGFKVSTLADFGIPKEKIIYTEEEQLYKFEFMLGVNNIRYHKEGIDFMREKYLSPSPKKVDRKVYLSRQKAKHRKIIGEENLIALLKRKGFEILDFADYTIAEQAEIMATTKELITIHGAGLANLIFANPEMRLLEILEDTFVNVNYWFYSNIMDVDYHYYLGKSVQTEYSKEKKRFGYDDIELSDDFYERLKLFLN